MLEPFELKEIYYDIYKFVQKHKKLKGNLRGPLWCLFDKKSGGIDGTGFLGITVSPHAKIQPCSKMNFIIGNIDDDLSDIWFRNKKLESIRNGDIKLCNECEYLNQCRGDRRIAYAYFNDILAPDPQCWKLFKELPDPNMFV
jgi:radical SAM protein with 4Fe4S-binding SPASM domain